jgi:hypothetical protein
VATASAACLASWFVIGHHVLVCPTRNFDKSHVLTHIDPDHVFQRIEILPDLVRSEAMVVFFRSGLLEAVY